MASVAPGDVTEMALEDLEESDKQGCPGHYRLYHWEILVGLAVAEYKDPVLRNKQLHLSFVEPQGQPGPVRSR